MGEERSLFLQTDHTIGAARTPERSILNGVLHGPYKYIEQRSPIARRMLFNLTDDPAETTDLLRDEPNVAEELASMLGDYLSASRPGIHLRIVNRPVKAPSLSRYRVQFSTTGRFTVLETRLFEKDDSAHISPNGRSLLIRTTGNNKQATGAGGGLIRHNWWIIDEERVVFQVDPSDSKIVLELFQCSDAPQTGVFVGEDKTPVETYPFEFTGYTVAVLARDVDGLVNTGKDVSLRGPAGGYLAIVPATSRVSRTDVSQETLDRLRALGYVGDADE